jgi:hypothetical protein
MKISIELTNCYGINSLRHVLDFTSRRIILIYAPNGSMKTSLAKVFQDNSHSQEPKDMRYTNRNSTCIIKDENGNDINLNTLVVYPYDDTYRSERISTLVVNEKLRKQYESTKKSIEKAKLALITSIGEMANTKKNTENIFLTSFNDKFTDSSLLLSNLESTINSISYNFSDIVYTDVINDKTEEFLKTSNVRALLKDYVDKYNEIISKSSYFRKEGFNPYNANEVSKNLNNNRYFSAKHSLILTDRTNQPIQITSTIDFDKLISSEKDKVLNNPDLKQKFSSIEAVLNGHRDLRHFYEYLITHEYIITELADVESFKQKLWISYIHTQKSLYDQFLVTFNQGRQQIEDITNTAQKEKTLWKEVVDTFKRRFFVPFEIKITNQVDAILNNKSPIFEFCFNEGQDSCVMDEDKVSANLSTGEQRALYLLNIIYEIMALEKESNQSMLVLDDIADSFDYKNKYAIIEYLKDISQSGKHYILILTHNFDFFRTVHSRLDLGRGPNCLMSVKTDSHIELVSAQYLNPFTTWRNNLHCNRKMLIASIPMVRNIIEYTQGQDCENYRILTSLLHQKPNSSSITLTQLADIINNTLALPSTLVLGSETVLPIIFSEADSCLESTDSISLENKIILSIAIRLIAEDLMNKRINEPSLTNNIEKNQTGKLFELYKNRFPSDLTGIGILDRVVMMTPEPIHLNSFMYEPLIDLSDQHLKVLYDDVKKFPPIL